MMKDGGIIEERVPEPSFEGGTDDSMIGNFKQRDQRMSREEGRRE